MKYPWVNDYREKAVTELEFLLGHLRNPGKRAACFFFRDKVKKYLNTLNLITSNLELFFPSTVVIGFRGVVDDVFPIQATVT